METGKLAAKLRRFAEERDWGRFHSPKNIASALVVEAAELLEIFQWMNEKESYSLDGETMGKARDEIADIQIYLVRLADILEIGISEAVEEKLVKNGRKYPVEKAKGTARKYDEL